jgi:dipeptidase
MKKQYYFSAFVLLIVCILSHNQANACFAIVAGSKATADGSVLLGHAEQNRGSLFVNFRVVPRITNPEGSFFTSQFGAKIPNAPQSWSYIWSEIYGATGSDALFNEWGVAIVSDATHSKDEDNKDMIASGEITDGGLGLEPRLEVAKKARSAREGVHIIGSLIEQFGYYKSGTTHVIADPNEAWIVTVIMGKRWIARRVPDDEVVVLANVNIIGEFNFNDTLNYLSSPSIVEYATKRGWYNPKKDKVFNFKNAYDEIATDPVSVKIKCDARQWRGQCLVTGVTTKLPQNSPLPFSVKPGKKLTVSDIRWFLSDHAEGTVLDKDKGYENGTPHEVMEYYDGMVCNDDIQEVAVFQLRSNMPRKLGCIYWRTSCAGCTSVLLPWYLGISQTPDYYYMYSDTTSSLTVDFHYNPPKGTEKYDDSKAFCVYNELENLVDQDYKEHIALVQNTWRNFEADLYEFQPAFEETALALYSKDKTQFTKFVTDYCHRNSLEALTTARDLIGRLKTQVYGF